MRARTAEGAEVAQALDEGAKAPVGGLSEAMRDLLWTVAQHKYGWAHCPNHAGRIRRYQTAEALERRGLVTVDRSQPHMPTCSATDAGRAEIERRWPVSPFVLGTYEHQPGGWTPRDSRPRPQAPGRAVSTPLTQDRSSVEGRGATDG